MSTLGKSVPPLKAGEPIRESWISNLVIQHNALMQSMATDGATFIDRHGLLRRKRSVGSGSGANTASAWLWVRLSSALLVGTNRWWYIGVRQTLNGSGIWADDGAATQVAPILNGCEAYNDGSLVEGNGVNVSGEAFTEYNYSLRALQGSPVVPVVPVYPTGGDNPFYVCCVPNAIDGSCE